MVHTSNAIIAATLALSAAAPILAAPVGPRIDSGYWSVNNSAPVPLPQALATDEAVAAPAPAPPPALEAPAKETSSSGVGDGAPATALNLTHHLFIRASTTSSETSGGGVALDSSPSTTAGSDTSSDTSGGGVALPPLSPVNQQPGGASASSSSVSSSEGNSDSSTTVLGTLLSPRPLPPLPRPLPPLPRPLPAVPHPLPAVPHPLPAVPHPLPAVPHPLPLLPIDKPLPPLPDAAAWSSSTLSPRIAQWSRSPPIAEAADHRELDADEMNLEARGVTPMDGPAFRQPTPNPSSTSSLLRTDATLAGLTGLALAGRATAILAPILSAAHRRDLDADTLRLLLGRDLEDLFARSFGIDELD